MKVEFLSFEESASLIDAEYARKDFIEASNQRLDYWRAHFREKRNLQEEGRYQKVYRELLRIEKYYYDRWRRLDGDFIDQMKKRFSSGVPEDMELRDMLERDHENRARKAKIKLLKGTFKY